MTARPIIKCVRCNGKSGYPMPDGLFKVFRELSTTEGLTTNELFRKHGNGCVQTAFNNRLEELRNLGLARRERAGRQWIYYKVI